MWSNEQIRYLNAKARRASSGLIEFRSEDDCYVDHVRNNGKLKLAPSAWLRRKKLDELFIDTSGVGLTTEPAYTTEQWLAKLREIIREHGPVKVGIIEFGQFQAYLGVWSSKRPTRKSTKEVQQ